MPDPLLWTEFLYASPPFYMDTPISYMDIFEDEAFKEVIKVKKN